MSQADKLDIAAEKRKSGRSPHNNKPLSDDFREEGESDLHTEKNEWASAPDFLTKRSAPSGDKKEPGSPPAHEPVTIELAAKPAATPAAAAKKRRSPPAVSYAFYAALFVATAVTSAAVVLLVM